MRSVLTLFCLLWCVCFAHAQYDPDYKKKSASEASADDTNFSASLGVGLGLDYGGVLGVRLTVLPSKYAGLFAGGGYNLNGLSYNVGGIFRLMPGKSICPFVAGMYGYNAVIVIAGASQFNKTYYGSSIAFGAEFPMNDGKNFLSAGLIIPFRSDEFDNDVNALKRNSAIELNDPSPVLISVGYHVRI